MKKILRLGTRDSELALWQATTVQKKLVALGQPCELVPVKSIGDLQLDTPLYELGITGIFTKTLDIALLRGEIDLAVHSMKDVPTKLPKNIVQAAVLERANPLDVLVHKGLDFLNAEGVVATGSLRRKAQWLNRYPLHDIEDLRGNVNTRLEKLQENSWDAAIFAAAGLLRINRMPENHTELRWMLPAPAQGAMMVVVRDGEDALLKLVHKLNHPQTALCTAIEREFLRELEGGCTAPIGALAECQGDRIHFRGNLLALDGQKKLAVEKDMGLKEVSGLGTSCAREILENGGKTLMNQIKKELDNS